MRPIITSLGWTVLAVLCGSAQAQVWPAAPVKIVVPYAAGGGVDIVTRIVATHLGERLKQAVIVDNKPGANANMGADFVAKAAADGYTLLMTSSVSAVNRAMAKNLPYDALSDFAQVAAVARAPSIMVVPSQLGIHSVQDLVDWGKAHPSAVSYASTGYGSGQQINGAIFSKYAGIPALHVPYKGGAPAMTDLIAGRVTFMVTIPSEVLPHVRSGKLTAIAVTGSTRSEALPDAPTFTQAGVHNPGVTAWWGLVAPARTPESVLRRLEQETLAVMQDPKALAELRAAGYEPGVMDRATFTRFYRSEIKRYADLIHEFNIETE
ncbi:Bug family tripartite tricarboxylate transporter substrate binding protein [Xylophilus sp. ASV27]|uniref:Bug family tripartite tricarboxylate transporter substrate binding protein n=1 Tax=Xylophilus sp. ASV27 TaxID=2795129 RepID=UPI0018EAAF32|nr:tripartite tricarboxylate transporter substrate binding protein [Xylophilus sp. ASV27]